MTCSQAGMSGIPHEAGKSAVPVQTQPKASTFINGAWYRRVESAGRRELPSAAT